MSRIFSLLLLIALALLPWTQPALADDFPVKPEQTIVTIPYPVLGSTRIITLRTKPEYTFLSKGPLYTSEGFRYAWICPDGASLINNACYAKSDKSEFGDGVVLVDPAAAQIAFGYNLDADSTTNEQLIYLASLPGDEISPQADDSDVTVSGSCVNPRLCVISRCADGKTVTPPTACPR